MKISKVLNVPDGPSAVTLEGTARIPIGDTYQDVEFSAGLDAAGMLALVRKAAGNKSRKSADGPLLVRIKRSTPVPHPLQEDLP